MNGPAPRVPTMGEIRGATVVDEATTAHNTVMQMATYYGRQIQKLVLELRQREEEHQGEVAQLRTALQAKEGALQLAQELVRNRDAELETLRPKKTPVEG